MRFSSCVGYLLGTDIFAAELLELRPHVFIPPIYEPYKVCHETLKSRSLSIIHHFLIF